MGDRISIQFKNGEDLSIVLFSHWDGTYLLSFVKDYYKKLIKFNKGEDRSSDPLFRLETRTVMVDFIRHLTKGKDRITSNYYFGINEDDGDNSDNGHFIFDLETGKWDRDLIKEDD